MASWGAVLRPVYDKPVYHPRSCTHVPSPCGSTLCEWPRVICAAVANLRVADDAGVGRPFSTLAEFEFIWHNRKLDRPPRPHAQTSGSAAIRARSCRALLGRLR